MKNHFIQLFNYDRHANEIIIKAIIEADGAGKPVQLLAHLLSAQQIWLNRCAGAPAPEGTLWPDWEAGSFKQLIIDNHQMWINFLDRTDAVDFEQVIAYQNTKGEPFSNKLADILTHVINHGTHHRAQAGQHLKLAGIDLPETDYIFYLRGLKI